MERIEVVNAAKMLDINNANVAGSKFVNVCGEKLYFENVTLAGTRITDANLSDIEIDGAQLGGAFIHNIGMPPECHPNHQPGEQQRPLRFENCNLQGSTITDCNLSKLEITDCNLTGMKINGVLVTELLEAHAALRK
ncbi:hypothetical protein BVG16_27070 [Paenibacillus selenitireducens]|uniref:Pentapeptide repeat-containing protein n=1 Tax=Paenibacillus selenitireducens TaxID=1324314 RepID=A0A1T2X1J0_9BACL|nr:pentapeptide repeat-containing protein [Paenibacillus selenitireducens]OPA73751.1 hypothetical protein BVG16_27070 [Paenibacillus selenitireducens]